MSNHNFFKKLVATTVVAGTTLHFINKYIIDKATEKELLNENEGNLFSFKYGDIFYKVSGEGTPILLIHDLNPSSSGMEWINLEKELIKNHKVYTLDLLGCGRSEKPKLMYNNFLYVQLITDFIKEVIKEPTDIIVTGTSVAPAIMAAKLSAESINRMMLINPIDLDYLNNVPEHLSIFKKHIILTPVIGTFIYHTLHSKEQIRENFLTKYYSDSNSDVNDLVDYYYESCHLDKSGSKYLYANLIGNNVNMNINHALKTINHDILVVSGEDFYESDYVPEDYARINENIECISIMDTSYLPQLEAPEKIADLIEEYWKS